VTIPIKNERISRVSYHLVLCHWFDSHRSSVVSCGRASGIKMLQRSNTGKLW